MEPAIPCNEAIDGHGGMEEVMEPMANSPWQVMAVMAEGSVLRYLNVLASLTKQETRTRTPSTFPHSSWRATLRFCDP